MKKNVLIITGVFPPEPLTSAYLNYDLAKALSVDYNVTVLRPRPSRPINANYLSVPLNYDKPFRCITLDTYTYPEASIIGRTRESISFGYACAKYIKKHHKEIDFLYNSSWQLFGYYIVAKAAVRYSIPYIVPIQDIYPDCIIQPKSGNLLKKLLYKVLLIVDKYYQQHAYRVRTISDEMANYLSNSRGVLRKKYLVVNNWQEDSAYDNLVAIDHDKLVFAFVGSINKSSRVEYIIRSFIRASVPNSELRIYGNGVERIACEEYVKSFGVDNIFFDSVPRENVPIVQANCDVLLSALPKGHAGLCLPSKLTSYMLTGRAIIVSVDEDSATARYVREAKCGLVVEPDNEQALANAFTLIAIKGKNRIEEYGLNSRKYAIEKLSKEANLNLVVETIKSAL